MNASRSAPALLLIAACLLSPVHADDRVPPASPPPSGDRAAILAMAGDFEVTFQFQETVALANGYSLKKPYLEHATETVKIVADEGDRIVLQHILLDEESGRVIKHWGQEWNYQDREISGFVGDNTWVTKTLPLNQVTGTWSQRVTQVDDSPRYESYGRWIHQGGVSSWESAETRRPLPRREYTKRDDYTYFGARNRHTITPDGWVHEQDNYKQVDEGGKVLCREVGLNTYARTTEVDFAAANEYWEKTENYWKKVSAKWQVAMERSNGTLSLKKSAGGRPLYKHLFSLASKSKRGELGSGEETDAAIDAVLEQFVSR